MLCRKRAARVGFYKLDERVRVVTVADGDHGATGHRGHGRGHGWAQGVVASVTSVLEQ